MIIIETNEGNSSNCIEYYFWICKQDDHSRQSSFETVVYTLKANESLDIIGNWTET